jgi:hypothetical protein
METGSPTSSAFSIPWLMLLVATLVTSFGFKLLFNQDTSHEAKSTWSTAGGQSRASQPHDARDRMARDSRKLNDEEMTAFLRGTILDKVEIVDKSLDESLMILRKLVRKAVPDGPVAGIYQSAKWPGDPSARIAELKLHDVPLAVAIKYVCDATKCCFRIDGDSVIIEAWHWMDQEEMDHFMNESNIEQLEIVDASLNDAIAILSDTVSKMKFHGRRISILIPIFASQDGPISGSQAGYDAHSIRVHDLKLANVSVGEALQEFCKRTNTLYGFNEDEQIFFEPNKLFRTK